MARAIRPLRLIVAVAALSASPALAQEPVGEDAIPPGQEALLSDMLGRGADLPGRCRWTGARRTR